MVVASCGGMVLVDRLVSALPSQTPPAHAVFYLSPGLLSNYTVLFMLHPANHLSASQLPYSTLSAHTTPPPTLLLTLPQFHCPSLPPCHGYCFSPPLMAMIFSHRTIVRPSRLIHVRPHDQKPERLPNPRTLSVPGSPSVSPPAPTTAVRPSRPRWTDSEVNRASSRRTVRRRWRR